MIYAVFVIMRKRYFLTNVNTFWIDSADFILNLMNINYCFTLKDVILYYENKSNKNLLLTF